MRERDGLGDINRTTRVLCFGYYHGMAREVDLKMIRGGGRGPRCDF